MDDMIAIVKTKNEAIKQLDEIRRFLKENLRLELNSKTQIFKSTQGVNFCGYKINEYRLKIREKGKRKLKKKIKIIGYDGVADYCYRTLYKGRDVFIYGDLSAYAVKVRFIRTL